MLLILFSYGTGERVQSESQCYICAGHAVGGRTVTIKTNHLPSVLHSHGHIEVS